MVLINQHIGMDQTRQDRTPKLCQLDFGWDIQEIAYGLLTEILLARLT
jgi:hypothetical protein